MNTLILEELGHVRVVYGKVWMRMVMQSQRIRIRVTRVLTTQLMLNSGRCILPRDSFLTLLFEDFHRFHIEDIKIHIID
jgi:hypothetical protein